MAAFLPPVHRRGRLCAQEALCCAGEPNAKNFSYRQRAHGDLSLFVIEQCYCVIYTQLFMIDQKRYPREAINPNADTILPKSVKI